MDHDAIRAEKLEQGAANPEKKGIAAGKNHHIAVGQFPGCLFQGILHRGNGDQAYCRQIIKERGK